ncbi:MAG: UPF0158 family protein [Eubacteriales bacterium]
MQIKLELMLEALEMASDFATAYYDIEEHKVEWIHEMDECGASEEIVELIEETSGRFFRIPNQYDIHEYEIMRDFVEELTEGTVQEDLSRRISGRGAFRNFKDGVNLHGIEKQWYEYKDKALEKIALEWCEERGFECGR